MARAKRKRFTDLDAYDLYYKPLQSFRTPTRERTSDERFCTAPPLFRPGIRAAMVGFSHGYLHSEIA